LLVFKEQEGILIYRRFNLLEVRLIQCPAQIDATDAGTELGMERLNFHTADQ
jgi:hypothetical protein